MKSLLVLSGDKSRTHDLNLAELARRLGADVEVEQLVDGVVGGESGIWQKVAGADSLAVSAETLLALCPDQERSRAVLTQLRAVGCVLVYGALPRLHDELIRWISEGALQGVEVLDGDGCEVPADGRRFTRQLAGSSFPRRTGAKAAGFVVGDGNVSNLLTVARRPIFVHLDCESIADGRRQSLFLSTASSFPSPDQRVLEEEDLEAHYETLVPLLVFVRAACGETCWHGARGAARLIIDDPVLRPVYGYLDFRRLFESMRRHDYTATVAYIPWNYTRTKRAGADFFRSAGPQFSLCVHGCDHTNDEYGHRDEGYLQQKSRLAMERMRRHETRTGMPFEPVMVFPQGRFSTACLRGLRANGFIAAINSTRFPVDAEAAPLSLWDLLEPACTRPHGFPVFCRHYVEPTFPLVFDLYLGRPAFIVEHHEFFQTGTPALESLVDHLNDVEPGLAWSSLSQAVEQTCWKRAVSDTQWEVRFFTDRFVLTNESSRRRSYRLFKEEPEPGALAGASIDKQPVALDRANGRVVLDVTLDPGQTAQVALQPAGAPPLKVADEGKVYAGKVLMRRALSEFRDEVLVKHPVMLASAKRIVRALKASSDSLPRSGAQRAASR